MLLLFTFLAARSSVAWFAAACVGRSTLHVPTACMPANSLKHRWGGALRC